MMRKLKNDYLLGEGIVTADQLQQAFALSKKMRKSVEHVLIEHFHVKKEAIGKSFSLFYDCPFREYDPSFAVPVELLARLKKTFLLNEYWVPMSWEKGQIEKNVFAERILGPHELGKGRGRGPG
jgi:hypothetical protein